jgi:dTDP-4-dehydrorhamnose 3,5-epimerase
MTFHFKIKKIKFINNASIVKNSKFTDLRGDISTIFDKHIQLNIIKKKFSNYSDKIMVRKKNTLVGIHGDNKTWKILKCIKGKILLVLVNCKKKDKNFGKFSKILLLENDNKSVVIPPNTGNSYLCMSSNNIIYYKNLFNGKYNDADKQFTYKWNDSKLKINWPIKKPILSKRDK